MSESELLNHLRGLRRVQYDSAVRMLRWLVDCADEELAKRMHNELKRDVLIPLEKRFPIARNNKVVVESVLADLQPLRTS